MAIEYAELTAYGKAPTDRFLSSMKWRVMFPRGIAGRQGLATDASLHRRCHYECCNLASDLEMIT